nr:hypothetical protein [Tanacetum cinerariifolium]
MSRDVLTIGSTMRIPLLYRGEYSQWVEMFMNYLEEQTDREAMINVIKNGDQPLPRVTQVSIAGTTSIEQPPLKDKSMWHMLGSEYGDQDKKAAVLYEYETFKATEGELLLDTYIRYFQVINDLKKCDYSKDNYVNDAMGSKKKIVMVNSDPLALSAEKTHVSRSKEKVVISLDSEGSKTDDFNELKKITTLLAMAFNRRKFYSKPTNNNLRTSSSSLTANKKQVKAAVSYEYETFKATKGELLLDTYIRYLQMINDLKKCGYSKDNCELNFKFLNNLQPEWKQYATMMRQNKNLMDINIDALYNILKQNQGDVNDAMGSKKKIVVTNVSISKEKVVVSSDSEGSEADDFGLPKMKFEKDHLYSTCEQGKIHQKHHKFKTAFASNKPLYLLYMDFYGPMRIQSINGKRYVLVVVDDYSRYTWVFFLHSKDEASEAEAIATACFTQNCLIIHKRFDKTPYELINKRKPNIKFFRVFGCRCYLLNDYEDVRKLKAREDIRVFVGYLKESAAFRIYNKRTHKIHESVNVNFDEISEMASKQLSLEPGLSNLNETGKSSNLSVSQVDEASKKDLEYLFQNFYDEYFDSSKIMKSSTTNVEPSINEEVFHKVSESFHGESSSSSLNDDVQQSPEEVILPQTNT